MSGQSGEIDAQGIIAAWMDVYDDTDDAHYQAGLCLEYLASKGLVIDRADNVMTPELQRLAEWHREWPNAKGALTLIQNQLRHTTGISMTLYGLIEALEDDPTFEDATHEQEATMDTPKTEGEGLVSRRPETDPTEQ